MIPSRHAVFQLSPIGISLNRVRDNMMLDVNEAFVRMFGYSRDEVIGRVAEELRIWISTDERTRIVGEIASAGAVTELEGTCRTKSGEIKSILLTTARVDLQGEECQIAMAVDITDRRRAQSELERTSALLKATLDATADGILVTDANGRIASTNRHFMDLWRFPPEVLEAKSQEIATGYVLSQLKDPGSFLKRVQELQATPESESEDVLELKDGRSFERYSQPQRVNGETVGRVWSFRDITERRQMQARLLNADRLASMGALAAGVAHEINNPLTYVMTNLALIAEELEDARRQDPNPSSASSAAHSANLRQLLDDTREGVERVRRIVRDLRAFSRVDDIERDAVDLQRLLDFTANVASSEIRHRARLVKDFGRNVPLVEGNDGRLGQVFLNLIVNAAQAIPVGDVANNEIRIVTRFDDDTNVIVEIHDTGCGIPQEKLGEIFLPFFTTKPIGEGTGLGLSISHSIVEALGGDIKVESRVGVGTVFRVRLPAARPSNPAQPKPMTQKPPSFRGERRGRILVIDDEVKIAAVIERILRSDHDVTVTNNGRDALDHIARSQAAPFDLVLCDLMMPEMSGMAVHAEIARKYPELVDKIVFVTGGAFNPDALAFLEHVTNERIEKPFDPPSLRALVRRRVFAASSSTSLAPSSLT